MTNTAPRPPRHGFAIGDRSFDTADAALSAALRQAYNAGTRPRCTCIEGGVELCIAAMGDSFILRRMPGTGVAHAPTCPKWGSRPNLVTLCDAVGSSAASDAGSDRTEIRLAFSLLAPRHVTPSSAKPQATGLHRPPGLSLHGLLMYLWQKADLTLWRPMFEGKRNWHVVRRRLCLAAQHTWIAETPLSSHLLIPEVFDSARLKALQLAVSERFDALRQDPRRRAVLIAELKGAADHASGMRATFKHLPFVQFHIDNRALDRAQVAALQARHGEPAQLRHLVAAATFYVRDTGDAAIDRLCITRFNDRWLPLEGRSQLKV